MVSKPVRFFHAGGFSQLLLESADDLEHLKTLDQTLWVASSCPTRGLDLEPETLDFIDLDRDGRIRVPEILETIQWMTTVLRDRSSLPDGRDAVQLSKIDPDSDDGAQILQTITRIHQNLGLENQTEVTLAQTLDRSGIFAAVKSNGDGVIPVTAAEAEPVAALIQDILDTVGGVEDLSGELGVTLDGAKAFFEALEAYYNWWVLGHPSDRLPVPETDYSGELDAAAESEPGELHVAMQNEEAARERVEETEVEYKAVRDPELCDDIFPFGEATTTAFAAVEAIRVKVEDYFEQAELAAFDAQALDFLNFNKADIDAMESRSRADVVAMLDKVPLAKVTAKGPLPLVGEAVNPAFAEALATLNRDAVRVILGQEKPCISLEDWKQICQRLQPYADWLASKAGESVESLGLERIRQLITQTGHRESLEALIALDAALAAEVAAVSQVERLLRLHRDLFRLLNNYVALPEFYDQHSRAIFQMGSLIIDGCALNLCVEVMDQSAHSKIAANSGIFLVYCQCKRVGEEKDLTICAAVTNRNVGRITVGKNAVFYDRSGKDWDAKVVQIISNPISLRESVWAPFKKIGDIVSAQMEKISASRQADIEKSVSASVSNVDQSLSSGKAPAAPAAPASMGALMAGGGVAIAAVSSSVAYLAQTLSRINDIYILYTIVVIAVIVIGPSMILGFIKLRARDIGMILEASGWAINGRMRINLTLARELTHVGKLPEDSLRIPHAYVEKEGRKRRRTFWAIFILIAVVTGAGCWWYVNRL